MLIKMLWRMAVCTLLAIAPAAQADSGNIHAFEGDVRVLSAAGERAAQNGLELNEGDTVKAGADAWALLAMNDGASLTLRPNTLLKIDVYRFDPAGSTADNSSTLTLLKGAFRAITGYIGRSNRDGYRIVTPTATIGVRGTDHEPSYHPPPEAGERMAHEPGTYDKVNEGESFIRHPRGEVSVKPGQHAFVHHNGRSTPRLLTKPPAFYQRHAAIDRRAATHRVDFHRQFEERHQKRLQEIRQRGEGKAQEKENEKEKEKASLRESPRHETAAERKDAVAPNATRAEERQTRQEQRREAAEKRQQTREAAQEQRRQHQNEEKKKREASRQEDHKDHKDHKDHRDRKDHRDHKGPDESRDHENRHRPR